MEKRHCTAQKAKAAQLTRDRQHIASLSDETHPVRQAPQRGPPDKHATGAQRQSLEHVCANPEAAVGVHLATLAHSTHHFRKRLDLQLARFRVRMRSERMCADCNGRERAFGVNDHRRAGDGDAVR